MKKNIAIYFLGFSILALAASILMSSGDTAQRQSNEAFKEHYKIFALGMPKTLSFAGQKVPLNDYDVIERYDREILTNVYWQSQTLLLLKRANRYFPLIEPILKAHQIPDDFKYVALAESGLQHVVSPANAAGFWQFLDKTGKRYGLEVNEEIDERYHIEKATKAACLYFKDAYNQLGDWSLVAASYNMGIEGVKRQLQNQGMGSYYDLYLNTETARYLFRIMAIKEICEKPDKYGFYLLEQDKYTPIATVKVKVDLSINNLAMWSKSNYINYKMLKLLNPWLRKPTLNVAPGKVYYIDLPKDKIMASPLAKQIINDTLLLDQTNLPEKLDPKPVNEME
jgi:membrane-bound lytic murein transglycosylase D